MKPNNLISKIFLDSGDPREEIKKLLEKFVRAKNATEMYTDGSGLQLFGFAAIRDTKKVLLHNY